MEGRNCSLWAKMFVVVLGRSLVKVGTPYCRIR
jgi:hypothetical protein